MSEVASSLATRYATNSVLIPLWTFNETGRMMGTVLPLAFGTLGLPFVGRVAFRRTGGISSSPITLDLVPASKVLTKYLVDLTVVPRLA